MEAAMPIIELGENYALKRQTDSCRRTLDTRNWSSPGPKVVATRGPCIFGTDCRSTIGLFVQKADSHVRKAVKTLAAMLGGALLIGERATEFAFLRVLSMYWWTLPLAVASASLAALTCSIVFGGILVRRIPERFLSALYLVCCPSVAILGLPIPLTLVTAPPVWALLAAPVLMLASAWVHYRSLGRSEGDVGLSSTDAGWERPPAQGAPSVWFLRLRTSDQKATRKTRIMMTPP